MKIELNDQERKALAQIIDIAIRAEGTRVADAGMHLLRKLEDEPKEVAQEPTDDKKKSK